MDKLLAQARKHAPAAEVFALHTASDSVGYENGLLKSISSALQSGVSLRLIKDNRVGFAYAQNLTDRDGLIANAVQSLKEGATADFSFPHTTDLPRLNTFEPRIQDLSVADMIQEAGRVLGFLAARTDAQIDICITKETSAREVMNSAGTHLKSRHSTYFMGLNLVLPGTGAALEYTLFRKCFTPAADARMQELTALYARSLREVAPPNGRMKVLFKPQIMPLLLWRLKTATSGKSIFKKESPLVNQVGNKLFDAKLTIYDDPLDERFPFAQAFDDEGSACRRLPIIENGVLKNFYYDLGYAAKMNTRSTGHGNRTAMWNTNPITIKPGPNLKNIFIQPGRRTFDEMVRSMDRGIIVYGALGSHSGNIPNGDFSVGLAPGLYVEKGEIVGRVQNTMISGNIYETMKSVVDIENACHPVASGYLPAVLFDQINVTAKGA